MEVTKLKLVYMPTFLPSPPPKILDYPPPPTPPGKIRQYFTFPQRLNTHIKPQWEMNDKSTIKYRYSAYISTLREYFCTSGRSCYSDKLKRETPEHFTLYYC